ncbi:MAG: hypothetical protein MUC29_09480 [Pyrinomonadaceae bacterium]|nr:hypothetical protein [Pyrinomonadaceae bacterium]
MKLLYKTFVVIIILSCFVFAQDTEKNKTKSDGCGSSLEYEIGNNDGKL